MAATMITLPTLRIASYTITFAREKYYKKPVDDEVKFNMIVKYKNTFSIWGTTWWC